MPVPVDDRASAGLGERGELGVPPDHCLYPLARCAVQLLEGDLTDNAVAEVAPGQSWAGEQEHQEVSEQAGPAGVNHL
jgi:hypothetical protein